MKVFARRFMASARPRVNTNFFDPQSAMVVLAASICTRGGKPLLSRLFRDISKDRITGLLGNFPSLISELTSHNTAVEDESIRYVYQPLEDLYVVLLTNKDSNILQDIDTLHLFISTISNMLRQVDELEIFASAFDILGAFDEIISLGYKENLTLSQVQTFMEMDSHEEKIQEIIERNKELEATEERKRRAKEIQRRELARKNLEQTPHMASQYDYSQTSVLQPAYQPLPMIDNTPVSGPSISSRPTRGGLQLGKKPTKVAETHQPLLAHNEPRFNSGHLGSNVPPLSGSVAAAPGYSRSVASASPAPAPKATNNGVLITVNEKISASLTRDGAITLSEVKGDLQLRINDSDLANASIIVTTGPGIQYNPHPNIDRQLFTQKSVISLKDQNKSFPADDRSIGVLRWRGAGKQDDRSLVPFVVSAWVLSNDGRADVTLEYELTDQFVQTHQHLENVEVSILVPVGEEPTVEDVPYEVTGDGVFFTVTIPIESPQGSFEFLVPAPDEESLFPMEIQFSLENDQATEADTSFGKVSVVDVVGRGPDEESLPFDLHIKLALDVYEVA